MRSHTLRAALVASITFLGTVSVALPSLVHAHIAGPIARVAVHGDVSPREETDDGPGVSESALAILPVEARQ